MPKTTKIGLGMIPVVVVLAGLYILFFLWHRKRRATRKQTQITISPPVPEKDVRSYNSSVTSRQRGSKVFRMSAFSSPVKADQYGQAQFLSQNAAPLSPRKVGGGLDSPIDGSSPFRLKRGDTIKRYSLGPELARLWPSPPALAWMKPLDIEDGSPIRTDRNQF
ncbi:hypothetical protein GQ44DRAFT_615691 [Phaeosphaeriaceae sp. PMI808]|nr:hypothetical protein GQ44DRAFT_615691 [Phaeosphaeriaceae sp. PMI808]